MTESDGWEVESKTKRATLNAGMVGQVVKYIKCCRKNNTVYIWYNNERK